MYTHSQKAATKMKQMKLLMDYAKFRSRKTPLKLLVYHLILNLNASLILILIISLQKKAVDDALSPKSPHIASLFKIVSSFLYENSASENAFSINKYMIQLHGTAVDSDIIDALRFVKGTILNYEVMLNVPITNRGVALDI